MGDIHDDAGRMSDEMMRASRQDQQAEIQELVQRFGINSDLAEYLLSLELRIRELEEKD